MFAIVILWVCLAFSHACSCSSPHSSRGINWNASMQSVHNFKLCHSFAFANNLGLWIARDGSVFKRNKSQSFQSAPLGKYSRSTIRIERQFWFQPLASQTSFYELRNVLCNGRACRQSWAVNPSNMNKLIAQQRMLNDPIFSGRASASPTKRMKDPLLDDFSKRNKIKSSQYLCNINLGNKPSTIFDDEAMNFFGSLCKIRFMVDIFFFFFKKKLHFLKKIYKQSDKLYLLQLDLKSSFPRVSFERVLLFPEVQDKEKSFW